MRRTWFTLALVTLSVVCGAPAPAASGGIAYQGRLSDAMGQPITDPVVAQFKLYLGGDAETAPSSGLLVYSERAGLEPDDNGVFAHYIGSGVPDPDCDGEPCVLNAGAMGDGTTPLFIEMTLDPNGIPGDADDDLLLPRTRVGTVPFAFRVDSIEGATGGTLTGTLAADLVEGRSGLTVGDGETPDPTLSFEGQSGSATLAWSDSAGELDTSSRVRFRAGLVVPGSRSVSFGSFADPFPGVHVRLNSIQQLGADGNLDGFPDTNHQFTLCYNCVEGSSAREAAAEYGFHDIWQFTRSDAPGQRSITRALTFLAPGGGAFSPFGFTFDTDQAGGYANPTAKWSFRTSASKTALHINQNGNVQIGAESPQPAFPLEVRGDMRVTGDLHIEPDYALRFGGGAALETQADPQLLRLGRQHGLLEVATPSTFLHGARFEDGLVLNGLNSVSFGPFNNPVPGTYVRLRTTVSPFADGNLDGIPDDDIVFGVCYNCPESTPGGPEVPNEYQMKAQWEFTYAPADGVRWVEHNWDFLATGHPTFRPYGFFLDVDQAGGFASPAAKWNFRTDPSTVAFHINQNGNVMVGGNSPQAQHRLEVLGTIRATDNLILGTDRALRFETREALVDDSATSTLAIGSGYDTVTIGGAGESRIAFEGSRVKLEDATGAAGASLVLGVCVDTPASGVVTLGGCNVVTLLGAEEVNSISPCDADTRGQVIHLLCGPDPTTLCDGDGTRCSGGNLRLAGVAADFTCSSDDVLTLVCDGTNWRQVGLAVN